MVLCDSKVWLALALSKHIDHVAARERFEAVEEPASVCFCRATQQTFLRLLTNAAVLSPYGNPPLTNRQAWQAYGTLVADGRIVLRPDEPAGLEARWRRFAARDTGSPKVWMHRRPNAGAFMRWVLAPGSTPELVASVQQGRLGNNAFHENTDSNDR